MWSWLVCLIFHFQTVKGAKVYNAAIAAVSDGSTGEKEGEEKLKVHTHSYCCLDYAQVFFWSCFYGMFREFAFPFFNSKNFQPYALSKDFLSQECQLSVCIPLPLL